MRGHSCHSCRDRVLVIFSNVLLLFSLLPCSNCNFCILFLSNPEVTSRQSWTFHLTPCVCIHFSSLLSEIKLPQAHKHRHNIHATEEWTSGERERPWCHERWGADPSKSHGQGLFSSYAFPEAARPEGRGSPACSSINPWYLTASAWGIWRDHSIPFLYFNRGYK